MERIEGLAKDWLHGWLICL